MQSRYPALISLPFLLLLITFNCQASDEQELVKHIDGVNKVNAEQLIELATQTPELLLIDSRIASDRAHGHLENSISLPDIKTDCDSLSEVIPDKQHPTLFYCNGPKCGRSAKAVKIAKQCGFTNLHWFYGGFEEWKAKNYPYMKQ